MGVLWLWLTDCCHKLCYRLSLDVLDRYLGEMRSVQKVWSEN